MSIRPKTLLIFGTLILLSLALVACSRERPPATAVPTAALRGTVAPSPTPPPAITEVTLAGAAGATGAAAVTPAPAAGVTPTAPAPQPVVISPPAATGGAATGESFSYTVQAGDTLAAIALRFDVTQDDIIRMNALADPNILTVGQQLKIPGAAPASVGTTATSPSATSTYVIQRGDTLNAVARRFNTTVAELMRLNNLTNPDRIVAGQRLVVPATGGTAPAINPTPAAGSQRRTHVVQAGDTLLSIARRYGVTMHAVQSANNITNPDLIYPGQVLVIP